jgi:hypothetical protein
LNKIQKSSNINLKFKQIEQEKLKETIFNNKPYQYQKMQIFRNQMKALEIVLEIMRFSDDFHRYYLKAYGNTFNRKIT